MYFDGIYLTDGSVIYNMTVQSAGELPASGQVGELFYIDGTGSTASGLYISDGIEWKNVSSNTLIDALRQISYVVKTETPELPNAITTGGKGNGFAKIQNSGDISVVTSINLSSSDVSGVLSSIHFPSLSGDLVNASGSTLVSLSDTGVNPGTYNRVTIDSKGRVISATQVTSITQLGISDVYTKSEIDIALSSKLSTSSGVATLDESGKIPASQLPSYVDDILEYARDSAFPPIGESGKIYVSLETNKTFRWTGSTYIEITSSPGTTDDVVEGVNNLYFTEARAQAAISNMIIDCGPF